MGSLHSAGYLLSIQRRRVINIRSSGSCNSNGTVYRKKIGGSYRSQSVFKISCFFESISASQMEVSIIHKVTATGCTSGFQLCHIGVCRACGVIQVEVYTD